ncbi:MAG: hypothetical protein M1837_000676 [Sclerophora amabilis]|nr:MAG: hypothetical protein M1837_000676 [Sclerophora amabilis]
MDPTEANLKGANPTGEFRDKTLRIREPQWRVIIILLFFVVATITRIINISRTRIGDKGENATIQNRVDRILSDTPLIDGHNDLAILIRFLYNNHIYNETFTKPFEQGGFPHHVDIPRLREGNVGGAFWSAFVPCPKDGSDFSDENYYEAVQQTHQQLDLLRRLRASYPSILSPPPTSRTALGHFHKDHQIISPLAIEGLHQIGGSPSLLRTYHSLGVRYATLTHNCHNAFADAALLEDRSNNSSLYRAPPLWNGISPVAGRALIREMNRLGMIVDLAHVSHATMLDVLDGRTSVSSSARWTGSASPVIMSHSSAYALCPHPRNVPDPILRLVARTDSLVMVNFSPDFIACVAPPAGSPNTTLPTTDPAHATLARVAEHILHIANVTGSFDHVGLGSDFDGIASVPAGLEDVSKFPALVAELLRRGVSDADATKVVGENLLRVWRRVDEVADEMQKAGVLPMEDDVPDLMAAGEG